jgi:hypothetical protein
MDGFNEDDEKIKANYISSAFNQLLAFTYLDNSDKSKYGTLMSGLQTQQSLKNGQYPKTITEATNVLSNHRHDNTGTKKNNDRQHNDKEKEKVKEEAPEMSFANIEGK